MIRVTRDQWNGDMEADRSSARASSAFPVSGAPIGGSSAEGVGRGQGSQPSGERRFDQEDARFGGHGADDERAGARYEPRAMKRTVGEVSLLWNSRRRSSSMRKSVPNARSSPWLATRVASR